MKNKKKLKKLKGYVLPAVSIPEEVVEEKRPYVSVATRIKLTLNTVEEMLGSDLSKEEILVFIKKRKKLIYKEEEKMNKWR